VTIISTVPLEFEYSEIFYCLFDVQKCSSVNTASYTITYILFADYLMIETLNVVQGYTDFPNISEF
jgi:hypothetical protein